MRILSIKINNILSIEDAEVTFDDKGLMLVKGWDYDNGRANGAGKTAIFNALSFALYDKLPRKVTASEILRRGSKSGYVSVEVQIGDDRYNVKRSRPKGAVYSRGSDILDISQEEWESKLKLNYNQFLKIAYCTQGTTERFLSAKDSDKKTFLLQLLDLDSFATAKKITDDKVKEFTVELETYKTKIATIDSKIDAYSESLVDENQVKHHIKLNNDLVVSLMFSLKEHQNLIKPDMSKYQKLEDDLSIKYSEITKAKVRREMLHEQYRKEGHKHTTFKESTTCYACGSGIDNSAAKATHEREQQNSVHEMARIKSLIDECDLVIAKEKQITDFFTKLKDKKKKESHEYDVASFQINDLEKKIAKAQQELKSLSLKLKNNSDLLNKITDLSTLRAKYIVDISGTQSKIELYKTVSAMYSPTGAQAYILDSVIENFNDSVSEYIKLLWSNASYNLLSYKENDSGDVSARFSEQLIIDAKEISIGSLSGGEHRALSLCVDFALVETIQKQFNIFVSPIILDEPFDGLDSEGRELIVDFLGKIAEDRHIIVIDHASEVKSMFSKTLMVEKRNGISSVSLET